MKTMTVLDFLQNSFLKPLLEREDVTDISFNGNAFYFQSNRFGRQPFPLDIPREAIFDFVLQLANLSDHHFSLSAPILDLSVERYRFHALGPTISRSGFQKATSFSLRISRFNSKPFEYPNEALAVLQEAVCQRRSIFIFGTTGTGKTELQKKILLSLEANARVIVIDNALELDGLQSVQGLDLNLWQCSEKFPPATLIESALRSHPDWLLIAEARGAEMRDVLHAALTGHPVITTLHGRDIESLPARLTRMVLSATPQGRYDETLQDIVSVFQRFVWLKKRHSPSGEIERFIAKIYGYHAAKWEVLYDGEKIDR